MPTVNSKTATFRYYATQTACNADTTGAGGNSGGSGTVSSGSASCSTVHIISAGVLYWRAFYGGDAASNINSSTSTSADNFPPSLHDALPISTLHQTNSGGTDLASPNNWSSITVTL